MIDIKNLHFLGRCICGNGTLYFYKSVGTTLWFDALAKAQQAVDISCTATGSLCACDEHNQCFTATNSTVHIVLVPYCIGGT